MRAARRECTRMVRCAAMLLALLVVALLQPLAHAESAGRVESSDAEADSSSSSPVLIDLHAHTRLSDGSDTPQQVVERAHALGVRTLALTDHDQLAYDESAIEWAEERGMEIVRGTELSCEWTFRFPEEREQTDPRTGAVTRSLHTQSKVHLLGYFTRAGPDSPLAVLLHDLQSKRNKRNTLILEELRRKYDIEISETQVVEAARAAAIKNAAAAAAAAQAAGESQVAPPPASVSIEYLGRPHIALALMASGHASSISDAFARYLSDENLPLPPWSLELSEAIQALASHGAVPVLAHPVTIGLGMEQLERELGALLATEQGRHLRGMEVYSSKHSADESRALRDICTRLGLIPTGGSDYHGINKQNVPLAVFGKGEDAADSTRRWARINRDSLARMRRLRDAMRHAAAAAAATTTTQDTAPTNQLRSRARKQKREGEGTGSWKEVRSILTQLAAYASMLALVWMGHKLYEMPLPSHGAAAAAGLSASLVHGLARLVKRNAAAVWLYGNSHTDHASATATAAAATTTAMNAGSATQPRFSSGSCRSRPSSASSSPGSFVRRVQVQAQGAGKMAQDGHNSSGVSSLLQLGDGSATPVVDVMQSPSAPPTPSPDGESNAPLFAPMHLSSSPGAASAHTAVFAHSPPAVPSSPSSRSMSQFVFCFVGLQVSFISWGYLQERIMTIEYAPIDAGTDASAGAGAGPGATGDSDAGGSDRFAHSDFLVLLDRVFGALIAISIAMVQRVRAEKKKRATAAASMGPLSLAASGATVCANRLESGSGPCSADASSTVPLPSLPLSSHLRGVLVSLRSCPPFHYTLCALSNVLSSWFQYEALLYVSFPLQVLSKTSKILFTMLAGRVVERKRYPAREFAVAGLIAAGLLLFRLGEHMAESASSAAEIAAMTATGGSELVGPQADPAALSELSSSTAVVVNPALVQLLGVLLLAGYIVGDSFTSTWQDVIFRTHSVSSLDMMLGVNLFSAGISAAVMLLFGKVAPALVFAMRHPTCLLHAALMSIFSAVGQLFIYHTISTFGAVPFASMMTARQLLSLALSLCAFDHPVHPVGYSGLALVVLALAAKVAQDVANSAHSGPTHAQSRSSFETHQHHHHLHADREQQTIRGGKQQSQQHTAVELQRLLPANASDG